jgi:hypothetical protein
MVLHADMEEHVAESPYPVRVLPAKPSLKHCAVSGEGRRSAKAGHDTTFIIEARDRYGNR